MKKGAANSDPKHNVITISSLYLFSTEDGKFFLGPLCSQRLLQTQRLGPSGCCVPVGCRWKLRDLRRRRGHHHAEPRPICLLKRWLCADWLRKQLHGYRHKLGDSYMCLTPASSRSRHSVDTSASLPLLKHLTLVLP